MRIESDGHSRGNPRLYELIEHAPKTGKSPTVWAWPELIDYLKVAGQPVAGPWPPHQEPRPDPDYESLPVAVPDPESRPAASRPESAQADPERAAWNRQLKKRIEDALGGLTPRERMVFEMRHYEGLRLRNIGEILGTTEEAAKNCLFRATQKMRAELGDFV